MSEDDTFLGTSMVFTNVNNPRSHMSRKHEFRKALVRKGGSIRANAAIVCGNDLGEYSFVGAGAVVTKNVPAYALMAGVPARAIGWMCQCGERLPAVDAGGTVSCGTCGSAYGLERDRLVAEQRPASDEIVRATRPHSR